MSEEYRAKVFKSGNSVALRLPKALGLKEGDEMMIVREDKPGFKVEPVAAPKRKIDLTGIWGAAPDAKPFTREEREFDDPPRAWGDLSDGGSEG
jgi:antitoxin VapB